MRGIRRMMLALEASASEGYKRRTEHYCVAKPHNIIAPRGYITPPSAAHRSPTN